MAPLFVYMETLMYCGFLGDFKKKVDPVILKAIEDFKRK